MKNSRQIKFNPFEKALKRRLKAIRLAKRYKMLEGAEVLGVSRKQLEDIETPRDYGCHIDTNLLTLYVGHYGLQPVVDAFESAYCEVYE
jgi:DNA-binding XRE family transcriptional regulator